MATCRSCGAEIRWAVTPAGKRMPVDAQPTEDGNVLLYPAPGGGAPTAYVSPAAQQLLGGTSLRTARYTSHFATCPHADDHRKRNR